MQLLERGLGTRYFVTLPSLHAEGELLPSEQATKNLHNDVKAQLAFLQKGPDALVRAAMFARVRDDFLHSIYHLSMLCCSSSHSHSIPPLLHFSLFLQLAEAAAVKASRGL